MHVLGIETTCDETAAAVVVDGKTILSNIIHSQSDLHSRFGGVVPELASRRHIDVIQAVVDKALQAAACSLSDIDLVAVAKGPGLIGALLIGITFAKALAWALKIPIVGVNHVEAHLYAAMMGLDSPITYPALGMVLSGSHTSIVKIFDVGRYKLIGETIDDAIGEAFDKVAKIMDLGYPGGPIIEKLALQGDPTRFSFKSGHVKQNPRNFSFSGIKTSVLYTARKLQSLSEQDRCDIAASFQEAVFQDVLHKLQKCVDESGCQAVFLGGGVTQNRTLQKRLEQNLQANCYFPKNDLCQDNGAMIAGLGVHVFRTNPIHEIEPETKIPFT